jgi:hypothetical protein
MMPCPEKCLVCGADWRGGAVKPGEPMEVDKRAWYECGASIWAHVILPFNAYQLFIKGCDHDHYHHHYCNRF